MYHYYQSHNDNNTIRIIIITLKILHLSTYPRNSTTSKGVTIVTHHIDNNTKLLTMFALTLMSTEIMSISCQASVIYIISTIMADESVDLYVSSYNKTNQR